MISPKYAERVAQTLHHDLAVTPIIANIRNGDALGHDSYVAYINGTEIRGVTVRGNGADETESVPLTPHEFVGLLALGSQNEAEAQEIELVGKALSKLLV